MEKTIIIAEAGVNHNGSMVLARKLVDKATESNVDYIKFQTFRSETLVNRNAGQAAYQKKILARKKASLRCLKDLNCHMRISQLLMNIAGIPV